MKTSLLSALALLLATPALAAPPTAGERTMIAAVDAEQGRTLALLERTVNQNSGTRNLAGVKAVADMLAPEFEALGFTVRW
ncbi:MAG: M20 family peptidase, partial [Novosphingobium sp.]|nr:M20 family peptidase [Novosphingobium sp.]